MNPTPYPHPTAAQLRAFDAGQLPDGEQGPVERHLEHCAACSAALDALPEAPVVALLRAFAGRPDGTGGGTGEGSAPTPADLPDGLLGHPRYRVLGVLGAGGMGVVYKAAHRLMNRVVALKVLHRRLADRPGLAGRFRREARAAARLIHPNIATAYDADRAGDTHFLVMEYVEGKSLAREVERRGPLPVGEACDYVRQAALGLQHAFEKGMVHRDIKPHNLMLTPKGQVKILNFGLAHLADQQAAPTTPLPSGVVLGTPDYVAPEQARDPAQADIRADIYSLGCTLYHLLAGRPPFPDGTPLQKLRAHQECRPRPITALRPDLPGALASVVERMLAREPSRRPPTPADVAADLARFVEPASVRPAPARRRSFRRRPVLAAGVLLVVGTLTLAGYLARPAASPAIPRGAPGPDALVSAESFARQKRAVRDRTAEWLRTNNRWGPDHPLVTDTARQIDQNLDGAEAFQVVLGPGLVQSGKATLLLGRAGALDVLELSPELARGLSVGEQGCQIWTYSAGDDRRRAVPRVLLSDAVIGGADAVSPERPITGSVAYRILGRWPAAWSLRLTYYFGTHGNRVVLLPRDRPPDADRGMLRFAFPPLGNAQDVKPGTDVVFVEAVTQDGEGTVVESNAAAAAVLVVLPGTAEQHGVQ